MLRPSRRTSAHLLTGASAALAALAVAPAAHAEVPSLPCTNATSTGTSCSAAAAGVYRFTVPQYVSRVHVDATGAWGGGLLSAPGTSGGIPARVNADLRVSGGQQLYVYVGGAGTRGIPSAYTGGGFNGGGSKRGFAAFGGGGASDVRNTNDALDARILVAAGGGGATAGVGAGGAHDRPAPDSTAGFSGGTSVTAPGGRSGHSTTPAPTPVGSPVVVGKPGTWGAGANGGSVRFPDGSLLGGAGGGGGYRGGGGGSIACLTGTVNCALSGGGGGSSFFNYARNAAFESRSRIAEAATPVGADGVVTLSY